MKQPKVKDKVKWWGQGGKTPERQRSTLRGTVVSSDRYHGVILTNRGNVLVNWDECTPDG